MDDIREAEILAICDTLGVHNGDIYLKDPQCLSSCKDLVIHLRRDNDNFHPVRCLLGESGILQSDLIPIFIQPDTNDDLSEVVLRLMVNLTNPVLLLYEKGIPSKDKLVQHNIIVMTRHLQAYKYSFVNEKFWRVIAAKMGNYIENMDTLLEDKKLSLERMLILIRNVVCIPADPVGEMRNDDDASIHDQVLWVLQKAGVLDLLIFMSASESTREFCMHIVEILTQMFREHDGEQLAKTKVRTTVADFNKDSQELNHILEIENAIRRNKQRNMARNFGGTFVVRGLKAASGNDQICHKPVQSVVELSLDSAKKSRKTPKNRCEIIEKTKTRRSTLSMRLLLKEFCTEFLNGAYNYLMKLVKDKLTRGLDRENRDDHDEIYYLRTMRFFMEFNRYSEDRFTVARVSETMSIGTFHYVQGLLTNYRDLMVTDKENIQLWSKRAHAGLRAYQELLSTLFIMEGTEETNDAAHVIMGTIFYLPEYRELCVGSLASYEHNKLSRNYFCDLIETNHIFLKMLENYSRQGKILVRRQKRRGGPTRKKNKTKKLKRMQNTKTEEDWDAIKDGLEDCISNNFEPMMEMIPFDAASDTPIDEQRETTLSKIGSYLSDSKFREAVSLFYAAQEVWPDADYLSNEPDIKLLKSIFLNIQPVQIDEEEEADDEYEEEEDEIEEFEHYEDKTPAKECEFDFRGFMEKYTHHKIVANYGNLFRHYENLNENVLHCILKMFHRLVFDLDYPALLSQASIFRTFQSILQNAKIKPHLKIAVEFFKHFWPKFVKLASRNPKMFFEILFWKNGKESIDIQEGYAEYSEKKNGPKSKEKRMNPRGVITEEEENEIKVLTEEYQNLPIENRGMSQIDWINDKLINGVKTKKVLKDFLMQKGLLIKKVRKSGTGGGGGRRNRKNETQNISAEFIRESDSSSDSNDDNLPTQYHPPSGSESDVSFSALPSKNKHGSVNSDQDLEKGDNNSEPEPEAELETSKVNEKESNQSENSEEPELNKEDRVDTASDSENETKTEANQSGNPEEPELNEERVDDIGSSDSEIETGSLKVKAKRKSAIIYSDSD